MMADTSMDPDTSRGAVSDATLSEGTESSKGRPEELDEEIEVESEDVEYDIDELRKQMDKIVIAESVKPGKVIESLKFKPLSKAKLYIPLCRMRPLEAIRPRLSNDVISLNTHFVSEGYMDDHGIFYVALQHHHGRTVHVGDEDWQSWSPLWKEANDKFDLKLRRDEYLKVFIGKMFHKWDGTIAMTRSG